uniref:Cap-25 n=1 Tax=Haemonchus contortus TaxID=6289 RepID=A0A7I4XTN2_HAECO
TVQAQSIMFLPFLALLLIHEGTAQTFQYIQPLINEYRKQVANGQAWKRGGVLPSSLNMFELEYSPELEVYASVNTVGCKSANFYPPGGSLNYYMLYGLPEKYDNNTVVPVALATWMEHVLHNEIDDQVTYSDPNLEMFANMVYYKATQVGCSYKKCSESQPPLHVLACVFDSAPQMNEQLYKVSGTGKGCKSDSDCSNVFNGAVCGPEGLCGR